MSPRKSKKQHFRFFDLPAEIRVRIYDIVLRIDDTIDLGAYNYARVSPLLRMFLACRQMHDEASREFYARNAFRIFSTDGKFMYKKRHLLSRMPDRYREAMTTLGLRLGPGWNKPPAAWKTTPALGLNVCTSVRVLKVLIELDPEDSAIYWEWMATKKSYTEFSVQRLIDILDAVPTIKEVQFDGYPSVNKQGPLMKALRGVCLNRDGVRICYGPLRGWEHEKETAAPSSTSKDLGFLTRSLSHLMIGAQPAL